MDGAGNCEYENYDNSDAGHAALIAEISTHGPCAVGMEACTGAWALHQALRGLAKRVEIIDPHALRERFPKKGKKTDRRDAHNLARYVKEEHGGIWVPDAVTRHRRQLAQLRESTNKMLTQAKNAVPAALKEHHVNYHFLSSTLWTRKARLRLGESAMPRLSLASQVAVAHNLSTIDLLSAQRQELEAMMASEVEQSTEMHCCPTSRSVTAWCGSDTWGSNALLPHLTKRDGVVRFGHPGQ
jgi:transposase